MVVPNAGIHHAAISVSSTQVVSEVLSKMLMVGITDPGMFLSSWFLIHFTNNCEMAEEAQPEEKTN